MFGGLKQCFEKTGGILEIFHTRKRFIHLVWLIGSKDEGKITRIQLEGVQLMR